MHRLNAERGEREKKEMGETGKGSRKGRVMRDRVEKQNEAAVYKGKKRERVQCARK